MVISHSYVSLPEGIWRWTVMINFSERSVFQSGSRKPKTAGGFKTRSSQPVGKNLAPRCCSLARWPQMWHVYRLCSAFLVLVVDSPDFSGDERVTPNTTSSSFQAEIRAVKHRVATSTVFFIRLWVPEVCVSLHSQRLDIVEDSSCLIQ